MKYIISLIIVLITSHGGISQEQMTLEKAISIGIENHYGIQIAEKNIEIAENNNSWAKVGRVPNVNLTGSFSSTLVNDNNPASFLQGTYFSGSLGPAVDISYVVFNGGRFQIAKDQLASLSRQQLLNKKIEIHNLINVITQQYYTILFLQEQKEVLLSSIDLSQDRLAYEETRKSFGATNSFNIIQFENALIADSTNIINQLQSIEIAERNLYSTLNIPGWENYDYPERLNTTIEEIEENKLHDLLSEENYTLKTLNMLSSLNRLNTKLQEAAWKPTVSVFANGGVSNNGFKFFADNPNTGEPFGYNNSRRLNGSIGANLNWNLVDGGLRKTDVANAKLQEDIDQLSFLEASAQLNNQLDILLSNYGNQVELLKMADRQVSLAARNLEITEERFKAGQVTSLDFRNIQTQYLNAAFGKVRAIYNLLITKNDIDNLVGQYD